jgi:hypothetical protein
VRAALIVVTSSREQETFCAKKTTERIETGKHVVEHHAEAAFHTTIGPSHGPGLGDVEQAE